VINAHLKTINQIKVQSKKLLVTEEIVAVWIYNIYRSVILCRMTDIWQIQLLVFDIMDGNNKVGRPHREWSLQSRDICICFLWHNSLCHCIIIIFLNPRKNEGGKKLRKVERGLKWKTSPGGPQRENRRAAIRH